MNGIIYIAINNINGKKYVGKTIGKLNRRINRHLNNSKNCKLFYFQKALLKYGVENFKWEQKQYPIEDLEKWEKYWIKELNTIDPNKGYNLTKGGEGFTGNHTKETKQLLRLKSLGNKSAANRINPKKILFIDLLGKKHIVEHNFNDFCRNNNLAIRSVTDYIKGNRKIKKTYKGWTIGESLNTNIPAII